VQIEEKGFTTTIGQIESIEPIRRVQVEKREIFSSKLQPGAF
jgi:hypothetical protein